MTETRCRFCGEILTHTFCDLGASPLANRYLAPADLQRMEPFYPLHAFVCAGCHLVQLEQFESPATLFSDYAYFSSFSESWLAHAEAYADALCESRGLEQRHLVVEVASNDGYLLQFFARRGVRTLGIEPAANVAREAVAKGIDTRIEFFGTDAARRLVAEGLQADLLVANNVLAHVPDLNDFVAGVKIALRPGGLATFEFPHLLQLVRHTQFDTIYHEHASYFSCATAVRVFAAHGLTVVRVERLPTHGGSLRLHVMHAGRSPGVTESVESVLDDERAEGLDQLSTYLRFPEQVADAKRSLLAFLIQAKTEGRSIAAYGAPAKGNTLLNFCGIRTDFIDYTVDRSPHKQGRFLPGSRIPVYDPAMLFETRPDYVVVLPWNLRDEIMTQLQGIRAWGGRFVFPVPRTEIVS